MYGIRELLKKYLKKICLSFFFYLAFWSYQAIGENFYLKPDKIRGLTSTSYNFSSNIFWGVVVFTLVIGIVKYFQSTSKSLELEKFNLLLSLVEVYW